MSTRYRWDHLYSATRQSIEVTVTHSEPQKYALSRLLYRCGCSRFEGEEGHDMVDLCQYHQGFEDGLEHCRMAADG